MEKRIWIKGGWLVAVAGGTLVFAAAAFAATFIDIGDSVHRSDIEAVAAADITKGCNPPANDRYCPDRSVNRGEMAAFLTRALRLNSASGIPFEDTAGSVFNSDIAAVAAAGITKGCNPPANSRYCPDRSVNRGEMAAFLTRALHLPAAPGNPFRDTAGSVFKSDIAALAAAGITKGCNPPANDRYCPDDAVRRDQMASFLVRALDLEPPAPGPTCQRWLDTGGSDQADGSRQHPWATLEHALERLPQSGCVLTVLPGTYQGVEIKRRFDAMTTIRAAQPYRAVVEGTSTVFDVQGARNLTIEGFEIRQTAASAQGVIVNIEDADDRDSNLITIRNNIIHDSYDDDLLKVRSGAISVTVEGNVFYNQAGDEQHIDINGVQDVVVQDNLFFNDFAGSGRTDPGDTKAFIVVKDSSGTGELGSRRVRIRRNVMLNWQGGSETIIQIGNDGKPYLEAIDVIVENNLVLGNSPDYATAPFGVAGAKDVTFANNTIVGDLPSGAFGARFDRKGDNPPNENIVLVNNIFADPTGTMGDFTDGDEIDATLHNNLYWNGGNDFEPDGPLFVTDDPARVVGDPRLPTNQAGVVVPRWQGTAFLSGSASIREEFFRIVEGYAPIGSDSPAIDRADPSMTPPHDILGRARGSSPDLGAWER